MSANHILITTLVQWSIEERARREKARESVPRYDAPPVDFPETMHYAHRDAIEQRPTLPPVDVRSEGVRRVSKIGEIDTLEQCVIGIDTWFWAFVIGATCAWVAIGAGVGVLVARWWK